MSNPQPSLMKMVDSQAYYTEDDMPNASGEDVGDAKGAAQDDAQHSRPTRTKGQQIFLKNEYMY